MENRFTIITINPKALHVLYIPSWHVLMERSYFGHNLASKSKRTELTRACRAESSPSSQQRSRFDGAKVIPTGWSYLLPYSNQQNLFSITAAAQEKMDLMHIDGYWFCNFRGTNQTVSKLFNSVLVGVMFQSHLGFHTLLQHNESSWLSGGNTETVSCSITEGIIELQLKWYKSVNQLSHSDPDWEVQRTL